MSIALDSPVSNTRSTAALPKRVLKWSLLGASLACVAVLGWRNQSFFGVEQDAFPDLLTYEVAPRDLPITVIERGDMESQNNVQVFCEVDDYRSDGINGTPIVWVIPNGSSVSEGDLICELDATAIQSELDDQILDTEEARSAQIQAHANVENQAIQNKTAEDKAKLDVELSTLELQMFNHATMGSHQLAVEAIQRQIDDLNNEILAAEMSLKLRRNEKNGIERLYKLGYAGKSEMDRSVLSYLQAEGDYAAKLNKLQTQMASKEKLNTFEREMQILELEGKLSTAKQNFEQVVVTNKAKMAQMEGILSSRNEQLKKEEERLKRYQQQLANCKIYAPQDGMVAYVSSSRDAEIGDGVPVRPRQHILSIPNLRKMQVKTSVHESVLDRVQVGLRAAVTIDAFPDRTYSGTVKSVAVLPKQSYYSDTKEYETIITIDEEVYQLKPGMTAVAEIHIDYLPNVNAIPIQAVVQRAGKNWLYVQDGNSVDRREVTLGVSNDQYVAVTNGISIGEQVVLNPDSLLEGTDDSDFMDQDSIQAEPKNTLVAVGNKIGAVN